MKRTLAISTVLASLALTTAACGGGGDTAASEPSESSSSSSSSEAPMETPMETEEAMAGPVGPGCADYAAAVPDGAGSVEGMTQDPVATAASNNPILTQLTAAVSGGINPEVNLVDTLNGGDFTVFAPVDDAFAALPAGTVDTLKADAPLLTSILTYHVVPGQLTPEDVVGMQTTVQGGMVDVAGTPEALTVNGANVICGGVQTANATVYLIDTVLTPPAAG